MAVQEVGIVLRFDHTAKSDKDPVYISKSAHDEICWFCPQGSATIQFKGPNGSPFASDRFEVPEGGSVCSGPVRPDADGGHTVYTYAIIGRIRGDRDPYVADPHVNVDD